MTQAQPMPANPNPGAPLAVNTVAEPPREVYEYEVPEDLREETSDGVATLGIVLLTPNEEKLALRRCNGDAFAMAFELAKASLREVNGIRVYGHDGSQEAAYARCHPKTRALLTGAYSELSTPEEAQSRAFLKSRRVKLA